MNEIEKLYENAGIKKIELDYPDKFEPFYPEFTAEKQFELIKFIAGCIKIREFTIRKSNEKFPLETLMTIECDVRECAIEAYTICFCNQPFDLQIASCINHLINADKLTSKERKQIREILE